MAPIVANFPGIFATEADVEFGPALLALIINHFQHKSVIIVSPYRYTRSVLMLKLCLYTCIKSTSQRFHVYKL
jgi:hypothetical protein